MSDIEVGEKSKKSVVVIIPDDTKNNIYEKPRGHDVWKFDLGNTIYSVYSQVFNDSFDDVKILSSEAEFNDGYKNYEGIKVQVEAFNVNMGLFQWSEHEISIVLNTTLYKGFELEHEKQQISGSSKSAGNKEVIAYLPIVGNLSFDKALSNAMTAAVVDSAIKSVELIKR
jgi:hypothetical protein